MDKRGQVNLAGASVGAIVGVISILIFVNIYSSLNKDQLSAGATSMLNLVDLVLAAVLIIGIVSVMVYVFNRQA